MVSITYPIRIHELEHELKRFGAMYTLAVSIRPGIVNISRYRPHENGIVRNRH